MTFLLTDPDAPTLDTYYATLDELVAATTVVCSDAYKVVVRPMRGFFLIVNGKNSIRMNRIDSMSKLSTRLARDPSIRAALEA